jgi:H+/Cl- antiporter ClcA
MVGLIVTFAAKEAKGHGVPEVMEAVVLRNGRIRKRVAAAKILASAICIGSGGSVGREGPIVQIGSSNDFDARFCPMQVYYLAVVGNCDFSYQLGN